jgi:hypothetical protein
MSRSTSDMALFLGAGASCSFGYPTTAQFLERLKKNASGPEQQLLRLYSQNSKIKDIEHILTAIDAIVGADSNPFAHAAFSGIHVGLSKSPDSSGNKEPGKARANEPKWTQFIDLNRKLKSAIVEELYREYAFRPETHTESVRAYQNLLLEFEKFSGQTQFEVFTINYDRVVEEYCSSQSQVLVDGFQLDRRTGIRFWKPEVFDEEPEKESEPFQFLLKLYKLHGSLDWRISYDGRIESVKAEEKCGHPGRYKDNILIYPTQQCLAGTRPFDALLKRFADSLKRIRTLVVIGYSFRDSPINDEFLAFLNRDPRNWLIVISPKASSNLEDHFLNRQDLRKKHAHIYALNNSFPDDLIFQILTDVFAKVRREKGNT